MPLADDIIVEPAPLDVLDTETELLQTAFWARMKERFGWRGLAFHCIHPLGAFPLLVLVKPLTAYLQLAYIPYGPPVEPRPERRESFLLALGRALASHLSRGTVFIRFDLPWSRRVDQNLPDPLDSSAELFKAPMDIQPPTTILIDLERSEEEILARMKSKTRYNIRLAFRKGVEVSEGGVEELEAWYALCLETARRDRITLHSLDYYRALFQLASTAAAGGSRAQQPGALEVRLLLAREAASGELLAGIILGLWGERARYLYGASSSRKRNLMSTYALQWRAIQLARSRGCRNYDLFGIPPANDPSHPMHGLYRFKTGFGGTILNRPGCYDLPLRPLLYRLYRAVEAGRSFYYRRLRKRIPF